MPLSAPEAISSSFLPQHDAAAGVPTWLCNNNTNFPNAVKTMLLAFRVLHCVLAVPPSCATNYYCFIVRCEPKPSPTYAPSGISDGRGSYCWLPGIMRC